MLVRANALGRHEADGSSRVMAACPDTDERGDPWRWSVAVNRSGSEPTADLDVDPSFITATEASFVDAGPHTLLRKRGEVLVVTVLAGAATIASVGGPWQRQLNVDDVFVLEGEEDERVTTTLVAPGTQVAAHTLTPIGKEALRWVP